MMQFAKGRIKAILHTILVIAGVGLIVGATANLPVGAQGIVTGRNDILIDQLTAMVGNRELTQAVLDADIIEVEPGALPASVGRRRNQAEEDRDGRGRQRGHGSRAIRGDRGNRDFAFDRLLSNNGFLVGNDFDDQLERLGPEVVYQVAVDAGLITQAESDRMLMQQ